MLLYEKTYRYIFSAINVNCADNRFKTNKNRIMQHCGVAKWAQQITHRPKTKTKGGNIEAIYSNIAIGHQISRVLFLELQYNLISNCSNLPSWLIITTSCRIPRKRKKESRTYTFAVTFKAEDCNISETLTHRLAPRNVFTVRWGALWRVSANSDPNNEVRAVGIGRETLDFPNSLLSQAGACKTENQRSLQIRNFKIEQIDPGCPQDM